MRPNLRRSALLVLAFTALWAVVALLQWAARRLDLVGPSTTEERFSRSDGFRNRSDRVRYPLRPSNQSNVDDDGLETTDFQAPVLVKAATKADEPRHIRYTLIHGRPYRHLYSQYTCWPQAGYLEPLPDTLQVPGVLDFFPDITTNLRIAVVGDSVGIQVAQVVEEALGSVRENRVVFEEGATTNLVVSGPVRGGGAFMSARVNGMLWHELQTDRTRRRKLTLSDFLVDGESWGHPTTRGRRKLPHSPMPWNRTKFLEALHAPPLRLGRVDVLVQRVTFPWTHLDMITMEALERNTRVAAGLFKMQTLVYVNLYFCNFVVDPVMYKEFRERLEVVRNFTRTFVPPANSTLRNVLLLDLDNLVDQLVAENARSLGYDVDNEPFEQWMMSHYRGPVSNDTDPKPPKHHYHAQVCGARVPDYALSCFRNMIFVEGVHFCPATFGGRITAGIACLIECSEVHAQDPLEGPSNNCLLRECERKCNDKFMSLTPLPMHEMVPYNQSSDT